VLLSVGHLHTAIQQRFGTAFLGMSVDYVIEDAPLGTGGALRKALDQASEETVLVLNGDTFLEMDYAAMLKFHNDQAAPLTVAITTQADIARYGEVVFSGKRIVGFREKDRSGPGWINGGVYAINTNIHWPAYLPERFSFEKDFLVRELAQLAPRAYCVDGFFLDIGVPEDLDRAQTELAGAAM
jgi:D-glycero-alpha-D-manno-heptose 1-phosphate guanylyltransferase